MIYASDSETAERKPITITYNIRRGGELGEGGVHYTINAQ